MSWGRNGVAKSRSRGKYPKNWNNITAKVAQRDGDKCSVCGKTKAALDRLNRIDGKNRRLETHHLFSVRTGNNKKTNLIKICSTCHAKQHNHGHLKKRK